MLPARAWLELLDLRDVYLEILVGSSETLIDVDCHFLVVLFGRSWNSHQVSSSLLLEHFDWLAAGPG